MTQNYPELSRTIRHHTEYYRVIRNHGESYGTKQNYRELYRIIQDYTELYRVLQDTYKRDCLGYRIQNRLHVQDRRIGIFANTRTCDHT